MDYYANAVRAEPGIGWRRVCQLAGYRMGSINCLEPVQWDGPVDRW